MRDHAPGWHHVHPSLLTVMTTATFTRPRINYDRGSKTPELFEYAPDLRFFRVVGPTIPSFDIGKDHFGVYVHDVGLQRCAYAGLWRLGKKMDRRTQERLTMLLDRLLPLFQHTRDVLVEQQRSMNYMAVRLQQHTLSYFELRCPTATRHNIASDLKYRKMDGPLGTQKSQRKRWAVSKSLTLFTESGDVCSASFLRALDAQVKGDDVGDAYLQYCAWRKSVPR